MRIIAISLLISIYTFSYAQNTKKDTSINCIAHWKKGEEKVLLISRHKESYQSGNNSSPFDFSYEAHVFILDSSKEGYIIKWVFHLTEEFKQANPGIAESMPVYEGLKMVFTTTSTGSFKELINWQEVKDAYVAMMELSLPKNLDDSAKAAIKQSNELFNSREMTEASLIKEIQLYYAPYGAAFSTKGIKSSTSLPNPFGGEPIPAIAIQKIKEINPAHDYFDATFSQEVDSLGTFNMIIGLFKKMNIPNDSLTNKAEEVLSGLQIKDFNEYRIKQSTGWIINMKYERIAIISGKKQTDAFTFETKQ